MTNKRLNGLVADIVNTIVIANDYNPETGANGGDRELAQGELGKALYKLKPQIFESVGLPADTKIIPVPRPEKTKKNDAPAPAPKTPAKSHAKSKPVLVATNGDENDDA